MAIHQHNMDGLPFVIIDKDGYLELYTHDGHKVQCNHFIRVQDSLQGPNTVIAKFNCNIVGSVEEMKEEIEKFSLREYAR